MNYNKKAKSSSLLMGFRSQPRNMDKIDKTQFPFPYCQVVRLGFDKKPPQSRTAHCIGYVSDSCFCGRDDEDSVAGMNLARLSHLWISAHVRKWLTIVFLGILPFSIAAVCGWWTLLFSAIAAIGRLVSTFLTKRQLSYQYIKGS